MRKKSHISLAKYLLDNIDSELLTQHRKAFVLGSVLPDCKPSFVTERHNIDETFYKVTEFVEKLTVNHSEFKRISTSYCRKLGEVTHYVADYFTYPHNSIYDGCFKDHCVYEGELKCTLKAWINEGGIEVNRAVVRTFTTPQQLCEYIKVRHKEYLNSEKNISSDCVYIISLCHIVVEGVLHLLAEYLKLEDKLAAAGA